MQRRKTILVVDDHPLLRRGLAALIESEPDLRVGDEVATGAAALGAIAAQPPDLVIVDLALEGSDGLDLIKQLKAKHPAIPALVLSMHDESVWAERALRAGARGYLTKQQLDDTVLVAIRRVLDGRIYMSAALEAQVVAKYLGGHTLDTQSPLAGLSDRELQVFRLLGQGRGTRQVAETLHLSVKTVETHCEHIKRKLHLGSAVALAHHAAHWVETGRLETGRLETGRTD